MKLIHCADLHLDSSMTSNLGKEKAKERKSELLMTFNRMLRYAKEEEVRAILIAGDLFDKKKVAKTALNTVWQAITENPQIDFFYLQGNHGVGGLFGGAGGLFDGMDDIPENLKLFNDTWTGYCLEDEAENRITISGIELDETNSVNAYDSLVLDAGSFNIVMLHGQEAEHVSKDKTEVVNIRGLRNKGIDYLALGHVHSYKEETLDGRGVYCYPGCLEGRGFDECGHHGFVLLDIDSKSHNFSRTFVPIAGRNIYALEIDVTGCNTTVDIAARIEEKLAQGAYPESSLMKFILTGEVDVECETDISYLLKQFEDRFYFLKIYDETKLHVDYDAFALDISLKGEFVRTVMEDAELDETEKADIIRCGIQLLTGEET